VLSFLPSFLPSFLLCQASKSAGPHAHPSLSNAPNSCEEVQISATG
jgi:hypothetical protein